MTPQSTIAHYRITAKLGEGGMGAVYRATDTKLNRDVAIKILPPAFAEDAARMQRFEREAQLLAALNHPNIAAIYGIEEGAIVMELVEGADLAGPLPVDTLIDYARQIAAGLEAAHEKGIVHRDLKPANIKVTPEGRVKLLDFGLAKAREESSAASGAASPTMSPTLSLAMTQAGMILGTAAYMSPEQARGKPVDRRADIWAFGVILYELLTGHLLYGGGETITDTIAAVVTRDPDWSALPADTPPRLRRLIERCLRKDPKLRMRDIGEARIALDEPEPAPAAATPAAAAGSRARLWIAATAVSTVALLALAAVHFRETPAAREMVRFTVAAPHDGSFGSFNNLAVSPDGRKLLFSATASGRTTLWLRTLDSAEARPLPGTENGSFPFWSPDSKFVGFTSEGMLKKIDLAGGPAQTLCRVGPSAPTTGGWTRDGYIYFANGREGIFRVSQAGGEPVAITRTNLENGESFHAYPTPLPDGRHMLMLMTAGPVEQNTIFLVSLDGKEKKPVTKSIRSFGYVPPQEGQSVGHLLVMRQDTLMAMPVNPATFETAGDPFPLAEHVGNALSQAFFSVSPNGTLAYHAGDTVGSRQLTWFDRTGKALSTVGGPGEYGNIALSRDTTRAATTQNDSARLDLWIFDLARGVPSRFTFEGTENVDPVWSPDGTKIAFAAHRKDQYYTLYIKDSSGVAPEQQVQRADGQERPTDWSPDGRFLMYTHTGTHGTGLWTVADPLDPSKRKASPFIDEQYNTTQGQFSPGTAESPRWVAYSSIESRREIEVFVQSFPAGAGKFQVSTGGGTQPRWRRDGKELFYMAGNGKVMAVDVKTAPRFEAGIPHVLFESHISNPVAANAFRYDVSADGQRFLINMQVRSEATAPQPVTVVLNWLAGVKK